MYVGICLLESNKAEGAEEAGDGRSLGLGIGMKHSRRPRWQGSQGHSENPSERAHRVRDG